jgi:hypothetical protein
LCPGSTWIYVDLCSENCSRTGALTALNANIIFLWHVTPYSFIKRYKFSEERAASTLREDNSSSLNRDASDTSEIRYLFNQTTRRHISGNHYLNSYGHNTEFINFLYHTWNSVQALHKTQWLGIPVFRRHCQRLGDSFLQVDECRLIGAGKGGKPRPLCIFRKSKNWKEEGDIPETKCSDKCSSIQNIVGQSVKTVFSTWNVSM